MKTILLLALTLTMTAAQAYWVDQNSSWERIHGSYDHKVNAPRIPGGLFNICHTADDKFKTVNTVKRCAEYTTIPGNNEIPDETVCVRYERVHFEYSREATRRVCVDWRWPRNSEENGYCARSEVQSYIRPLSYKVEVEEELGDAGWMHAFYKNYTIPSCN